MTEHSLHLLHLNMRSRTSSDVVGCAMVFDMTVEADVVVGSSVELSLVKRSVPVGRT